MGYILPISHFGYADYQRRIMKDKEEFHYVEKPYKVIFDIEQQFMYDQDVTNQTMQNKEDVPAERIKVTHSNEDQLIANITGKGSLFNESI